MQARNRVVFGRDDGSEPGTEYARHLKAIRHQLPPELLATQESVARHDARLREWVVLPAAGTARLVPDGYTGHERFTLMDTGVERVESTSEPAGGL